MGCIASKFADEEDNSAFRRESPDHVVSLTSTTYGALNLDREAEPDETTRKATSLSPLFVPFRKSLSTTTTEEPPEVIDAWELMGDLEEELPICSTASVLLWCSPTAVRSDRSVTICSPLKRPAALVLLTPSEMKRAKEEEEFMSPARKLRNFGGKENQLQISDRPSPAVSRHLKPFSPIENTAVSRPLKPLSPIENKISLCRSCPAPVVRYKVTPTSTRIQKSGRESGRHSGSRRSLSPMFDPELVAALEKEHFEEKEQIKLVVCSASTPISKRDSQLLLLESLEERCPPGGQQAVVLYTTTLRGIRKTFEDCNAARSAIESYGVQVLERDISMDSGFREELRALMGTRDVRVPVAFVKGRLVGGAAEVLRLEEEGKLELLLDGVPRAAAWCDGCGGLRFVMCMDCSGSCKVLDEEQSLVVKCGECNENGLIRCPICC